MGGVEFSRDEVKNLVDKLVGLKLSKDELELLLAIFKAASGQVIQVVKISVDTEPTALSKQLIKSFIPDGGIDFVIEQDVRHGPTKPPGKTK